MNTSNRKRSQSPGYNAVMIRTFHRFALALIAVTVFACVSTPSLPPESRPEGQGRVEITMTGFESAEGQALVAFFLDAEGWPDGDGSAYAALVAPIRDGQAFAFVEDVPAGPFAVSVFHDTDDDRELDSGALGIPSEAYGFSADARDMFGPPSFEQARLELAANETKQITIRVK